MIVFLLEIRIQEVDVQVAGIVDHLLNVWLDVVVPFPEDNVLDPQVVDGLVAIIILLADKPHMQVEVITPSVVVEVTLLALTMLLPLILKAAITLMGIMLVKVPKQLYGVLVAASHVEVVVEVDKDVAVLAVKPTWEKAALRMFNMLPKKRLRLLLLQKFIIKTIPMTMNTAIIIPTKWLLPRFIGWMHSMISTTKMSNTTKRRNMNIDNQGKPAVAFSIAMKPLLIIKLM
jgi:hypothetical protein